VTITNTGTLAGDEVAELYLIPPQQDSNPLRSLAGFKRVHLAPKASTVVHFTLDPRDLSEVDKAGQRAVQAGAYQIYVGGSQPGSKDANGISQDLTITGSAPMPE
jgi:beta-glucosidase